MKRGPISTALICVGLALLGLGFVVSMAALALVPGLVLIVVGFTGPGLVKHREAEGESENRLSERRKTTNATEHG